MSSQLTNITALDGRYHDRVTSLQDYFSEFALIRIRVEIELRYLLALSRFGVVRTFSRAEQTSMKRIYQTFSQQDAEKVKQFETVTRHDVKAVEHYLRARFKETTLKDVVEYLHFGLTSEDVNNISHRLLFKRALHASILPSISSVLDRLTEIGERYMHVPMLARTHGQPAVPTTVGKELIIFASRAQRQLRQLRSQAFTGKWSGAVGSYNAFQFVLPKKDWMRFSNRFVTGLGLEPSTITTQINPYDDLCEAIHIIMRMNAIFTGLSQDMWRYISDGWFVQEVRLGEVGSSTMPQKVNPIDFENSEGNFGVANSLGEFFCRKLPISRLQRDLSDSTTMRSMGSFIGHSLIGYTSLLTGLGRVRPNEEKIARDLQSDWSILTEGLQSLLRYHGIKDSYTIVSTKSRGKRMSQAQWRSLILRLPISQQLKKKCLALTPESYIGLSVQLTQKTIAVIRKG